MDKPSISGSREAAFAALLACQQQGAWSDQAIRSATKKWKLAPRDAALAANLCYGVVQNQMLLDFWVNHFSKTPAKKLDPQVLIALRLGLYQLHFLDRIPDNAAVNESVNLVKKYVKNKGASGLVNAVLRAFQRADAPPMPDKHDHLEQLSVRYSHPLPLVKLLNETLGGEGLNELLSHHNTPTDMVIQVNTLKTDSASLAALLAEQGVETELHPWLMDCLLVRKSGDLEQLSAFQEGLFYVQDCAAKLAALVGDPHPGDRVLDACSAPGGKSFACGIRMNNEGSILSRDLHENKLRRIQSGAKRLGLSCITTQAMDARIAEPDLDGRFQLVLADVPCSGLGIIRKKPDIRYKNLTETEGLPAIQMAILNQVASYVAPGGTLVYSTCTVLKRENECVVSAFLAQHPEFSLEPFQLPAPIGTTDGQLTLWPHLHGTDGFFIAKLRRSHG